MPAMVGGFGSIFFRIFNNMNLIMMLNKLTLFNIKLSGTRKFCSNNLNVDATDINNKSLLGSYLAGLI
jgi:hypothetical protein